MKLKFLKNLRRWVAFANFGAITKLSFLAIFVMISAQSDAAIFGADDRVQIRESSPYIELARATAISVLEGHYEKINDREIRLDTERLEKFLCPSEKFRKDRYLSYSCSGFLVAPDLMVTAGHCMVNTGETRNEKGMHCEVYSWLFDYRDSKLSDEEAQNVPAKNLYKCQEIIYAINEEVYPYRDFALVRLDRKVNDRKPLQLSKRLSPRSLRPNERLSMIGYPMGTPVKRAKNAKILLDDPSRGSFITNLDALDGNSGSAVFDSKNKVVGILIGGTPSRMIYKPRGRTCEKYNKCDSKGKRCDFSDEDNSVFKGFQRVGSEVQRIAPVVDLLSGLSP